MKSPKADVDTAPTGQTVANAKQLLPGKNPTFIVYLNSSTISCREFALFAQNKVYNKRFNNSIFFASQK